MADNDFLNYIRNLNPASVSEMVSCRVLPSFYLSIVKHGIMEFSDDVIKLWVVDMLLDGLKPSTIKRYTGALHTLYKKWMEEESPSSPDLSFYIPLDGLASDETGSQLKMTEDNLQSVSSLTKLKIQPSSPAYLYNNAFLYLLYNPEATLHDVVALKYSDALPDCPHVEDIVSSMRKAPQAKYVFPLQQGKRREPAIVKDLLSALHNTGRRIGLSFGSTFSRESISAIWIAAALKRGIPVEEILSIVLNIPPTFKFLSLIKPVPVSERRKKTIINEVADYISNKTPGWFVLRMRSGVEPVDIKMRLEELDSPLRRMIEYFYPQRSIKKMEKKKIITVQKPVIPGILFFHLPYDRVSNLIAAIGDLAWCYRSSNNVSSPYSVIPKEEMRIFQRCVGQFTGDIEMEIVSELPPLEVGDEVIIEDGSLLDGQQAVIRKVRSIDGTLTYSLQLSDSEFLRWKEVTLPASHLSKVESSN